MTNLTAPRYASCAGANHNHQPARLSACKSCTAPVVSWQGRTLDARETGNRHGLRFKCYGSAHQCPSRADLLPGMITDAAEHGDFARAQMLLNELVSLS